MRSPADGFARFARFFGAQDVPESALQEQRRSANRIVVCLVLPFVFIAEFFTDTAKPFPMISMVTTIAYGVACLVHTSLLRRYPKTSPLLTYVFAASDPIALALVFSTDPRSLPFLNPLLLTTIVSAGMRYGHRTMYLVWFSTAAGLLLVFSAEPYLSSFATTAPFVLMLAVVPFFFSALIRQSDRVKMIESERARLAAMSDIVAARGAFLGRISHEIRSPLQTMVAALDLVEMKYGGPGFDRDIVGRMRRASLLLNTQLRDLLTLAAGDAGRLVLSPEPFEVIALLEAMIEGVRALARDKGLALVLDVPDEPVFVVADAARIDQVLTNLVVNSIRYTRSGEVRVALRLDDGQPRRSLRFVVADTGPGIPADMLPHVLSPDRVAPGTGRRGEGSGLGLAIVRMLVDRLGAAIAVTSEERGGTTFTLDVPVAPPPEANTKIGRDAAHEEVDGAPRAGTERPRTAADAK